MDAPPPQTLPFPTSRKDKLTVGVVIDGEPFHILFRVAPGVADREHTPTIEDGKVFTCDLISERTGNIYRAFNPSFGRPAASGASPGG